MAQVEDTRRATLSSRANDLRAELKQWERDFAASHDGRKATREEVKADAEVAKLYKRYHSIKDALNGKSSLPNSALQESGPSSKGVNNNNDKDNGERQPSRKRKEPPTKSQTLEKSPSKRHQKEHVAVTTTPRRPSRFHEHLSSTPDSAKENRTPLSMKKRAFVGPTPQKDGVVLGLFDSLPAEDAIADGTPTKTWTEQQTGEARTALGDITSNHVVLSTPSKDRSNGMLAPPEAGYLVSTPSSNRKKRIRTPQSAGRRYLLDRFLTPSKQDRNSADGVEEDSLATYPKGSASKSLGFSTPAFLRRHSSRLEAVTEVHEDDVNSETTAQASEALKSPSGHVQKPSWLRRPGFRFKSSFGGSKPPAGRSLSTMISDLRKAEDDRLDEEMELMREMEGGDADEHARKPPAVLVKDSQNQEVEHALGPDGVAGNDEDELKEAEQETSQPARRWKKKGQRRQTRRVILKPKGPATKAANARDMAAQNRDSDGESDVGQDVASKDIDIMITETQQPDDIDSDYSGDDLGLEEALLEENGDRTSPANKKRKRSLSTTVSKASTKDSTKTTDDSKPKEEGRIIKAARKVSETAHANYRRLKIRSKGGSGKGRFGKGRR